MEFYDMITKFGYDIIGEMPDDIEKNIKIFDVSEFKNIDKSKDINILNDIWSMTKKLCKNYIENDLVIDVENLFEDIKFHSILSMLVSIRNKDTTGKPIQPCVFEYHENMELKRDKSREYTDFMKKWTEVLAESRIESSDKLLETDLIYCFNKSIEIEKIVEIKKTNSQHYHYHYLIKLDSNIFCQIIKKWNYCPYSKKRLTGMNFKDLSNFYKIMKSILDKPNANCIDKSIEIYTIERFFNILFIYKLEQYLQQIYKEEINKYEEYIKKCEKEIQEIKAKLKEEALKNQDDIKYTIENIRNTYENLHKDFYVRLKNDFADKLLVLSELVSIPMVFSRNKYIDFFYKKYENHEVYVADRWYYEFKNKLYYLNNCIIPLLLQVYYHLIFLYFKNQGIDNEKINDFICDILERYIKSNIEQYKYDDSIINNFKVGTEAFQVNITNIIYNYKYDRKPISKNDDIFVTMKELDSNINSQILRNYNFERYNLNFPNNAIYSIYRQSKHNEL